MAAEDRSTRWLRLLQITQLDIDSSPLQRHTGELSHPDYQKIRADAELLYRKWPMFAESELRETLEWLLTFYCRKHHIPYNSGMHELMAPFFLIGFQSVNTLYICFERFVDRCVPTLYMDSNKTFDLLSKVFRHLLLYYDPLVCNQLDSQIWTVSKCTHKWFGTLFSSCMDISLLLAFWELILIENNLVLPCFFGLVLIERNRSHVLTRSLGKPLGVQEMKEKVFEYYINDLEELEGIIMDSKTLLSNTPRSIARLVQGIMAGKLKEIDTFVLSNSFTIEMDVTELKNSKRKHFVIDLREPLEYEKSHLPHSYNLPKSLKFSTEEYWLILSAFTCSFSEKTGLLCNLSLLCGLSNEDLWFASTLALDLARRGLERVSLIKSTLETLSHKQLHDTELCHRCEINRNIRLSAQSHSSRAGRVLSAMIYHWNREEVTNSHAPTPLHSEYTTPRADIGNTNPPIINNKAGSMVSTKMGSIGDTLVPFKKSFVTPVILADVVKGIKMIWGSQLYEGELMFEQLAKEEPICALHYAEAGFLKGLISGEKKMMKSALERLEAAEKLAENTVKKGECEPLLSVVLAEILLFKAGAHILKGNYIRASITLRKAWKAYMESEKAELGRESDASKETCHRLLFGKGILLFFHCL